MIELSERLLEAEERACMQTLAHEVLHTCPYAPGISDDARGLAVVLEVLRTLQNFNIQTEGDLLFIGSVGEEGNGDLRGGKYLFSSKEEHIDGFISVDSACVARLLHGSTGSRRFRVTLKIQYKHLLTIN